MGCSPKGQPLSDWTVCGPSLLPSLPAFKLREEREGGGHVIYGARQAGRQKSKWERTEGLSSKPTKEGEGNFPLLTGLPRASSPAAFPYTPHPTFRAPPVPRLLQAPSKSGEAKRRPLFVLRKDALDPEEEQKGEYGQEAEKRGSRRRHSGWGNSALAI